MKNWYDATEQRRLKKTFKNIIQLSNMSEKYSPCPAANNPLARCPYFLFSTGCGGDLDKCYRRRPIPTIGDSGAGLKLLTDGFLAEESARESREVETGKANAIKVLPNNIQNSLNSLYC